MKRDIQIGIYIYNTLGWKLRAWHVAQTVIAKGALDRANVLDPGNDIMDQLNFS